MHDFTYYAQILISGLTIGSLYALIAIGYTMVYGILRLINFAHGDMFMVAGFIMIYITSWSSGFLGAGSIAVGLILTLILTVVLGVMIEKVAYKPLRSAPRMSVMISAIGVSYLLQNLSTYVTGGLAQAYPNIPWLRTEIEIGGITVRRLAILTPVLTILLVIALVIVIKHTKMGMAMRAVAKDFDTAQLMGIRIDRVISITFVIVPGGGRLHPVFQLHRAGQPHHRRHAGSQILRGGGIRRHWLGARRGHRLLYHRYLRNIHQIQPGYFHLQQCLYLCAADHHPPYQAQRPVWRETEGEGVNDEKQENTQFDLFPSSGGGAGGCAAVYR